MDIITASSVDTANKEQTKTVKRKAPPHAFKKGQSGNPSGRAKLPADIAELKRATGVKAIQHLAKMVKNINNYDWQLQLKIIDSACDRCGQPKMSQQEISGTEGGNLVLEVRYAKKDNPV